MKNARRLAARCVLARRHRERSVHRVGGALPARRVRGSGAADPHRDVERRRSRRHPRRRAVRRRRVLTGRIQRRRHRRASRSVTGRVRSTGSTCRPAPSCPGGAAGRATRVGPGQGCLATPPEARRRRASTGSRSPGARRSTRPPRSSRNGDLYFGAGNAASPVDGGYYAYAPNGTEAWNQVVTNPSTRQRPRRWRPGVAPIADGGSLVEGGSLGQETYALNSSNGSAGHRLAAVLRRQRVLHRRCGRLLRHGLGRLRRRRGVVDGLRPRDALFQWRARPDLQRPRRADLQRQHDGGGRLVSRRRPASCPAVRYGIATGTGTFYPGASDENTVKVYDTKCNQVWSDTLDGSTGGSPALADVQGNGTARRRRGHGHGRRLRLGVRAQRRDRRHHLADEPARCRPRLGDHGRPDRKRRPGRDRPDRPRLLHPRRSDRADGGPRRRRDGRWRHPRRAGRTASRTRRW